MPETGDDGCPWGFMDACGYWVRLPKRPGLVVLGPPPFDVTLPDGRVRRIVHNPEETPDAAATAPPHAVEPPGGGSEVRPAAVDPGAADAPTAAGDAADRPAPGVPTVRDDAQRDPPGVVVDVTHFAAGSRVRLVPSLRGRQPEIGDAIGKVLEAFDGAVRVAWPDDRLAWHRRGDLEAAP